MYEENNNDYDILCKYLKMDQEVSHNIKLNVTPNFKTLTYFVHDQLTAIPLTEENESKTEYKMEKKKVLEVALKRLLKK